MRMHFARSVCVLGVILFGAGAWAGDRATMSLVAVKKTSSTGTVTPFNPPQSKITVAPGDTIEAEIRIADWNHALPDGLPEGIRGFQARILGKTSASSGPNGTTSNGTILPVGWDASVSPQRCGGVGDPPCPGIQLCRANQCVGDNHNPRLGAFVTTTRTDFVMNTCGLTPDRVDVNTGNLDYFYFGIALENDGCPDPGFSVYAGTLLLKVSDVACGQFTYELDDTQGNGATILDGASPQNAVFPTVAHLVMNAGTCPPLPIPSEPENCSVDARYPHSPSATTPLFTSFNASNQIKINFDKPVTGIQASAFQFGLVPIGSGMMVPSRTVSGSGNVATITFSAPLPRRLWTCITHVASGRRRCFGILPGDANFSALSNSLDMLDFLDFLDGDPSIIGATHQCDFDRSGKCTAIDVWAGMNLLVGSGQFFPGWNNLFIGTTTQVTCPSEGSQ